VTVLMAVATGLVAVLATAALVAVATVSRAAVAGFVAVLAGGAGVAAGAGLVAVLTTLAALAAAVEPVAGAEDSTVEIELTGLPAGGEDAGTDGAPGASPDVRVTAAAAPLGTARTASSRATAVIQRILNLQTSPTCVVSLPRIGKNLPIF
jgi:hypothetical protein